MSGSTLPVIVSHAQNVQMTPAPINLDWIIEGAPFARSAALSNSVDGDAFTCLWDCTAGTFRWYFGCDETVLILEGSVVVTTEDRTFTLSAGDSAYFPVGSDSCWKVDQYVRKVAFLRETAPRPISLALRVMRKLRRMLGGNSHSGGLVSQAG